jgi:hypothetical protein
VNNEDKIQPPNAFNHLPTGVNTANRINPGRFRIHASGESMTSAIRDKRFSMGGSSDVFRVPSTG